MTYLSRPPRNINLIGQVCDSLGKDSVTLFVGNHWATGRLQVNLISVKGGIIIDPLFACTGLKCKLWQYVLNESINELMNDNSVCRAALGFARSSN